MPWKNFHIWHGRLPHWRADDVSYYVTFRHRRELDAGERNELYRQLLRVEGKKLDLDILLVHPMRTELIMRVREGKEGLPLELAQAIEPAKRKAGKAIIKKTGERFPPFYEESFDRIIRDEAEYEEKWTAILEAPVKEELCDDPEQFETLFVRDAP